MADPGAADRIAMLAQHGLGSHDVAGVSFPDAHAAAGREPLTAHKNACQVAVEAATAGSDRQP
jgi:hypothetical protein